MITLKQLLESRELRAARQRELLAEYPSATSICLTVQLPGSEKRNSDSLAIARAALEAIREAFPERLVDEVRDLETGFEGYFVVWPGEGAGEGVGGWPGEEPAGPGVGPAGPGVGPGEVAGGWPGEEPAVTEREWPGVEPAVTEREWPGVEPAGPEREWPGAEPAGPGEGVGVWPEREWPGVGPEGARTAAKRIACHIEDTHPLGRMMDIDVITPEGPLSRKDIGLPERRCLICDAPARYCMRARLHTAEELLREIHRRVSRYLAHIACVC